MDGLTEQISALLSDPEGMERLKSMAEGLFGGQNIPVGPPPEKNESPLPDIGAISKMAALLKPPADDARVRLLYALKPHLSEDKQQRVDRAVKMLRLLSIAPLLSQMGLFEL